MDLIHFDEYDEHNEIIFNHDDYFDGYEESFQDVWYNCVILSIFSILGILKNLIIVNVCFGLIISSGFLTEKFFHIFSACFGIYLLTLIEANESRFILLLCFLLSYFLLQLALILQHYDAIRGGGYFIKVTIIPILILCEYYFVKPEIWLEIRGIVMILFMKLISLSHDIQSKELDSPSIIGYFGYALCGANVLFGPWVSYREYISLFKNPKRKNLYWLIGIFRAMATSLFFLSLSNCWANYLISENSNRWLIGYKEAFSFRTSHYFICFLSEVGMVAAGFSNSQNSNFEYSITEPLQIEFPSSLAVVVKKWNKPMHEFLKKYIYRSWWPYGKLRAIFITFLMSSFLHGLEMRVSLVLINIGVFSYLQVVPRDKFAELFDCCIRVRPCKICKHKYKSSDIRVRVVLFIYSLTTVLHLIYLGVLMDPSTEEVGILHKWQHLYYISHIVMFFNSLFLL